MCSTKLPTFSHRNIHIDDECLKDRWHECPKCQAKIKELGIIADEKHSAEQKLKSYIMVSVEKLLRRPLIAPGK